MTDPEPHPRPQPPPDPPAPAVACRGLSYTYPGADEPAIEGVDLDVARGSAVAVVGPNGAGKTTLLRVLTGDLPGYTGEVRVLGVEPGEARRRGLVGVVPQRAGLELGFPITGRQVVELAAGRRAPGWRGLSAEERERADRSVGLVDADAFADRPVGSLSGGQLQRVLLARALALGPGLLALDEPTTGVDAPGRERLFALLARLRAELGVTVVMVMHDLREVALGAAACDRIACLRRTVHYHDAPGGVTPQVLADVFRHDLSHVFGDTHVLAHKAEDCPDPTHDHDPGRDAAGSGERGAG